MRRFPMLARACALALLAGALCLPAAGSAGAAGRGPIAAPDALGPWAVGRLSFSVTDTARGRTLPVDAWYPVDPEDAFGPPTVYDLLVTGIESDVAFERPPVSARGPFPLVVFSHGSGGVRFQSWFLTEALASHGFLVVAPDHVGNTALDAILPMGTPFEPSDRPLDVSLVIDRMIRENAERGGPFRGRIDPSRIAVVGHSFGAFTALATAAGFADVPPDPRVDAIVPISPVSTAFSADRLGDIDVPALVLGGTSDTTTPIDPQSVRAFEEIGARPRYRVDVEKAGHNSFTNVCDIADALLGSGLPEELLAFLASLVEQGCAPELIPVAEAHRLTVLYAVSFLKDRIDRDPRFRRFLTEGRVTSRRLAVELFAEPGGGRGLRR